jgi:BirA family biotin operon repressor/biotin-[acetyl-CoA-carboxylase] ligase
MIEFQPLLSALRVAGPSSASVLGDALECSPQTLVNLLERAREAGLITFTLDGDVQLCDSLDLLDSHAIEAGLRERLGVGFQSLDVLYETDSTNAYLTRKLQQGSFALADGACVCLAEYQSSGRGRRGRSWSGDFGASVLASVLFKFSSSVRLDGLSLALGVGVVRGLAELGVTGVGLKWPNDLLVHGRKAAGILVESRASPERGWYTISGVGLNVHAPFSNSPEIDQPWIALDELLPARACRTQVAISLLAQLIKIMEQYRDVGFAGLRREWLSMDLTMGRRLRLTTADGSVMGVGRGVDADGALRVEIDGAIEIFHSADVSLRIDNSEVGRK